MSGHVTYRLLRRGQRATGGARRMDEGFRPLPHAAPRGALARLRFAARLSLDLQVRSVHSHMRQFLPSLTGDVLDIGCGQSPYRHLLGPDARYFGIDFEGSRHFEYADENDVTYFDGRRIPLADASIDHVICTEVLEHCPEPALLVQEVHRVLRQGGTGAFTVPWSARNHYIPHDYYRYTPSMLEILFKGFARVRIEARGTDLTAISSKIVVAALRPLLGGKRDTAAVLGGAIMIPAALAAAAAGQLSLALGLGSPDDPLGYTVWITK